MRSLVKENISLVTNAYPGEGRGADPLPLPTNRRNMAVALKVIWDILMFSPKIQYPGRYLA